MSPPCLPLSLMDVMILVTDKVGKIITPLTPIMSLQGIDLVNPQEHKQPALWPLHFSEKFNFCLILAGGCSN